MGGDGALSIAYALAMFVLVVAMAYFSVRWLGKRYGLSGKSTGNIEVLDRMPLGQDKALIIVRVAGQTLLLGVGAHHVELICTLDQEQITLPGGQAAGDSAFSSALLEKMRAFTPRKDQTKKEKDDDEQH